MNKARLSPPWFNYVDEIIALFGKDPDIKIWFDPDSLCMRIYVDDTDKAAALDELLPKSVKFGEEELSIIVVPDNENHAKTKARLFELAFRGNPAVTDIVHVDDVFSNPMMYIEFEKKVIQYYNDDLSDLYGNKSTLLQEIAKEIFKDTEGVFFCTAADENEDD